jgi:hypothetical protein
VNVTLTPLTGLLPASFTVTAGAFVNAALTAADCGVVPAFAVMLVGIVNAMALLPNPLTITRTLPELVPVGTLTTIVVALQLVAVPADVPLNVTLLDP